jgi:hypothetical protein
MTASTTKRNQIDASEDKPPCNKTSKDWIPGQVFK